MGLLGLTPESAYSVTPVLPVTVKAGSTSYGTPTQSAAKTEINWVSSAAAQYNQVGVYELKYTSAKGTSAQSASKKLTVSVRPLATAFTHATQITGGATATLTMPATNAPSAVPYPNLTYVVSGAPTCSLGSGASVSTASTIAGSNAGLSFRAPKWSSGGNTGTCTFTYTMSWTASGYTLVSDPAVATVPVKR